MASPYQAMAELNEKRRRALEAELRRYDPVETELWNIANPPTSPGYGGPMAQAGAAPGRPGDFRTIESIQGDPGLSMLMGGVADYAEAAAQGREPTFLESLAAAFDMPLPGMPAVKGALATALPMAGLGYATTKRMLGGPDLGGVVPGPGHGQMGALPGYATARPSQGGIRKPRGTLPAYQVDTPKASPIKLTATQVRRALRTGQDLAGYQAPGGLSAAELAQAYEQGLQLNKGLYDKMVIGQRQTQPEQQVLTRELQAGNPTLDLKEASPEELARRRLLAANIRPQAMAKIKANNARAKEGLPPEHVLTEEEVLSLAPGSRKKYLEQRTEALRAESPFTHERLTEVPDVPQAKPERWDPPRGSPEYMQRLATNEPAYQRVLDWARQGMTEEGLGWYNTQELRDAFVSALGEQAGNERFDRFIDLVASTSAGAKVPKNISIASYYDLLAERGLAPSVPGRGTGYGHKAQQLHYQGAEDLATHGNVLDPLANPKRYTYGGNLKGNWAGVTVDKHNVRAWGIASEDPEFLVTKMEDPLKEPPAFWDADKYGKWKPNSFNPRKFAQEHPEVPMSAYPAGMYRGAPTQTDYKALEAINERLAKDLGVTPAQAQAALWLGAGETTGLGSPPLAFAKVFDQVLRERAAERGIGPREVLDQFLQGVRPLAVGGAALGGAEMLRQQQAEDSPYGLMPPL